MKKTQKKNIKNEKKKETVPEMDTETLKKLQSMMQNQPPKPIEGIPGMGQVSGVELMQRLALIQKELGVQAGNKKITGESITVKELELMNNYAVRVIGKFGKYIRAIVMFGSSKRKKSSDLDVAILIDDTDVRSMSQSELKTKLFHKLVMMGRELDDKIHPQPYTLTEWWQYVRYGNPVIFNVIRTGVPIYDLGFFLPIQIIFKKGLIKPTSEAIDQHMEISGQLIIVTEELVQRKLIQNLEQAIIASAQALLMEHGYRPPAQREVPVFLQELVKLKKLDSEYVKMSKEIIESFKGLEHGTKTVFTFTELGKYYKNTKKFVLEMEKLLKIERKKKGEDYTYDIKKILTTLKNQDKKSKKSEGVKRAGFIDMKTEKTPETNVKGDDIIKKGLGKR